MNRVIISHPHAAAYANGAAAGLARAGLLEVYFAGVAAARGTTGERLLKTIGRRRRQVLNRLLDEVPQDRVRSLWPVELFARAVGRWAPVKGTWRAYDALFGLHDLAVASLRWSPSCDAVYAYEDGALATFKRAAKLGIPRVWDLPIPHWKTLEELWRDEATRWPGSTTEGPRVEPEWKKARKEAELELASRVVVASAFTRASLEAAGCRKRIDVVPYGFPVEQFRPRKLQPSGPFTVLAVGTHDLRKGTPYLLEAWKRAALRGARLKLVGPLRLARGFLERYSALFEHVPHVARSDLQQTYEEADLLAFPTLGDGFGMVIQEAMCCGVPVATTRCGGGPECIRDGVDGWIVPERSVDALVETFRSAAASRDRLIAMGLAAAERASVYPWPKAGEALAAVLGA